MARLYLFDFIFDEFVHSEAHTSAEKKTFRFWSLPEAISALLFF